MEDASERFDEYMKSNPDWWADVLHSLLHLQHSSVPRGEVTYKPLNNWTQYFADRCNALPLGRFPAKHVQQKLLSEALTRPLTIFMALQSFGLLERMRVLGDAGQDVPLILHILGCEMESDYALPIFAELTHLLPWARLHILLCGPNCTVQPEPTICYRNLHITTRSCLYHDLVRNNTTSDMHKDATPMGVDAMGWMRKQPHCVVAFNMGYSSSWLNTVQFLVDNRTPTIITGIDKAEMDFTLKAIEEDLNRALNLCFAGANPFGSQVRMPNCMPKSVPGVGPVESEMIAEWIASNAFWAGFMGALDKTVV
eukprot:CAMPEP_0174363520 /NCGR_PEP_ID=MMETSP0811_2-20130205/69162_1 /TAXON_ID=73025 ORGANISM="Eutreptiella gymnastica-like, Strain CCMP1594" /NCGR_SAMPLE_ID=MMETSP0811_2 /ASSEMBLY_ACC=CAM_ASM_000667 /LENGTH=310 /DNA_ID=CAMNT_0015502293 /DNA_START=122 /DNA_END=1054 /DNA_ORIENTATION=+